MPVDQDTFDGDEYLVEKMRKGYTPHDIHRLHGVSILYAKALFPYGNFDSFAESCRRMFIRGQSAIEIASILNTAPSLIRKCIGVTMAGERLLVALLRMDDNGFTVTDMCRAFKLKRHQVVEILNKFGRSGDNKKLFSWYSDKIKPLGVDSWYQNLRKELVEEADGSLVDMIRADVEKEYDAKANEIIRAKTGIDVDIEDDAKYTERVLFVAKKSTGLTIKAITNHALCMLGKRLGIPRAGRVNSKTTRRALIRYQTDTASVIDDLEGIKNHSIRMARMDEERKHGNNSGVRRIKVPEGSGLPSHLTDTAL